MMTVTGFNSGAMATRSSPVSPTLPASAPAAVPAADVGIDSLRSLLQRTRASNTTTTSPRQLSAVLPTVGPGVGESIDAMELIELNRLPGEKIGLQLRLVETTTSSAESRRHVYVEDVTAAAARPLQAVSPASSNRYVIEYLCSVYC